MRLTNVLNKHGHNLYRYYKYQWVYHRKRTLAQTGEREVLEKLGTIVCKPEEVFSKPYEIPCKEDYFPPPPQAPEPMEELYSFSTNFKTLINCSLPVLQNFSTSIIHEDLPKKTLENQRECSEAELDLFRDCILSSHLLDAYQDRLPYTYDGESPYPVRKPRRDYGISVKRKNELLSLGLSQCFDSTSEKRLQLLCRPQFMNTNVICSMRYMDKLSQLSLPCPLVVCSPNPLLPSIPPEDTDLFILPELDEKTKRKVMRKQMILDTGGPLQQPLPDIFPMSPLAGSRVIDNYPDLQTKYVSNSRSIYPHTVHIHHNETLLKITQEELTSLTLLNLYAHAVSFAYSAGIKINSHGHLSKPVVIQAVHSHLNLIQPAVFQLHTLGPDTEMVNGNKRAESKNDGRTVRNVFFYRPFAQLYEICHYDEEGRPTVTKLNEELLSVLRAMHEN